MGKKRTRFKLKEAMSVTDVLVTAISPAFNHWKNYNPEAYHNPRYLFKKKRYTRKKRKELLARHDRDVRSGKHGWPPLFPEPCTMTKKLTFSGSLTAKDFSNASA